MRQIKPLKRWIESLCSPQHFSPAGSTLNNDLLADPSSYHQLKVSGKEIISVLKEVAALHLLAEASELEIDSDNRINTANTISAIRNPCHLVCSRWARDRIVNEVLKK